LEVSEPTPEVARTSCTVISACSGVGRLAQQLAHSDQKTCK
jgi:hypothetical protein